MNLLPALYIVCAVFFAVVLVGVGIYETRRADRIKEERISHRLKEKEARASR